MSKVLEAIRAAANVMDGAAIFIANQRAALAKAQEEAKAAGVDLPALNDAAVLLETEAAELAASMVENTSAATIESTDPATATVVDPATVTDPSA